MKTDHTIIVDSQYFLSLLNGFLGDHAQSSPRSASDAELGFLTMLLHPIIQTKERLSVIWMQSNDFIERGRLR